MKPLPLYQNTVPKSCGPLDILHTKFISLPVLTYKSDGPNKIALNSAKKRKEQEKKTYFNFLRHMVYSWIANRHALSIVWYGWRDDIVGYVKNQLARLAENKNDERERMKKGGQGRTT